MNIPFIKNNNSTQNMQSNNLNSNSCDNDSTNSNGCSKSKCYYCPKKFNCINYFVFLLEGLNYKDKSVNENSSSDSKAIEFDTSNLANILDEKIGVAQASNSENIKNFENSLKQIENIIHERHGKTCNSISEMIYKVENTFEGLKDSIDLKLDLLIRSVFNQDEKYPMNAATYFEDEDEVSVFLFDQNLIRNNIDGEFLLKFNFIDSQEKSYPIECTYDGTLKYKVFDKNNQDVRFKDLTSDVFFASLSDDRIKLLYALESKPDVASGVNSSSNNEIVLYEENSAPRSNDVFQYKKNIFGKEVLKKIKV